MGIDVVQLGLVALLVAIVGLLVVAHLAVSRMHELEQEKEEIATRAFVAGWNAGQGQIYQGTTDVPRDFFMYTYLDEEFAE